MASHLASQNVWVGIYLFQFLASVHARISKCRIWLCFAQWPSLCCAQLPGVLGWWRTDNSNQKFPGWRTSEFDPIGHRSHLASTPYLRGPHTSFVNRIAHTSKKLKKSGSPCEPSGTHHIFLNWTRRIMVPGRISKGKKNKTKKKLSL